MINVVADISHYTTNSLAPHAPHAPHKELNFEQAFQSGLKGLIHKATEGATMLDHRYAARKHLALGAGLLWGAYHFGTNTDGVAQAHHFLETVKPGASDLLVLDFEPNVPSQGGTMSVVEAERFVQHVRQVTGRYPGLYSTAEHLTNYRAGNSPVLTRCWLWIAEYRGVAAPRCPPGWRTWTLWQYTDGKADEGTTAVAVPGIGHCDRDKFNGELAELQRLWRGQVPVLAPSSALPATGAMQSRLPAASAPVPVAGLPVVPALGSSPAAPAKTLLSGLLSNWALGEASSTPAAPSSTVPALVREVPRLLATLLGGLPLTYGLHSWVVNPTAALHDGLTQLLASTSQAQHAALLHGLVVLGIYAARGAAGVALNAIKGLPQGR